MFMAEIQIPNVGSVSKKCETLFESVQFLNRYAEQHKNYKKAEVFDLSTNQTVVSLRVLA